ncbi:MAG: leucine--tRNA ligase [Bacillota bacterium]
MSSYSRDIDAKWQQRWEETDKYRFNRDRVHRKLYCLSMFSYPSGAELHVGHWWNFGLTDSWARMKRMQGYEVFEPMGFDAFGLPAENYAIETGIHPRESTMRNIATMRGQLRRMGAMFDWDYEVVTCDPSYYRWTQWLFLQLYRAGLAYRAEAPVNWCPNCMTVLANEQVVDGCCERCDSEVIHRSMTQWFFRITRYADRLLEGLDHIDWPNKTKIMQRNWIGRSEGAGITFPVPGHEGIEVFTTRPDTLFGANYLVLAPEHPLVQTVTTEECAPDVNRYCESAARQKEIDRLSTEREKTGVFTGGYARHPLTGEPVPIWIADYVIMSYGTGAIMAVPGHDERDYEFARKYDIPVPRVIAAAGDDVDDALPYTGEGVLVNSGDFDGMDSVAAREAIVASLQKRGLGEGTISYRLRDWLVSRQRYWGAPIPMIHCDECGIVPVPEEELPVRLPEEADFTPKGKAPLASSRKFMETACPECGQPALRDPDTLDTFVDSAWYFLRYPDSRNSEEPFDSEWINQMLPVDQYVGGVEHATMHLLYARFITMAMHDLGYVDFEEPFSALVHQGIILGPDGRRMSKSRGNVVSPDDYIDRHGSDVFRLYLAFGFNYREGGAWEDEGLQATARFVQRVQRWIDRVLELRGHSPVRENEEAAAALEYQRHFAIKKVTEDGGRFSFNTCVARMMEIINALYRYDADLPDEDKDAALLEDVTCDLVLLMAPFTPHFSEEMWSRLGKPYSVFDQSWPQHDPRRLVMDTVEMAVQVNGRVRGTISVPRDAGEEDIRRAAEDQERIREYLADGVKKVIVVPQKLVNFVV